MKKFKHILIAAIVALTVFPAMQSCKKGEDDPGLSLRSRKQRITNDWTLTKVEKNGENQDVKGQTYKLNFHKSGSLTQTVQGTFFGATTTKTSEGTWEFVNDKEDVKINIDNETTIFQIQRLAHDELILKENDGGNTYTYYFE
ncbi:MAG: hypothetical protein H7321_05465 [Bacteroidia bacterium]|nr:hypothetical protein [Bacteroidia bacterium]